MENISSYNAQLVILEPNNAIKIYYLSSGQTVIGRKKENSKCNIQISSPIVSQYHGMITSFRDSYYYNNSSLCKNSTYINGKEIIKTSDMFSPAIELKDGDVITIGSYIDTNRVYLIFSTTTNEKFKWKLFDFGNKLSVSIGRAPENDIELPNISVSRRHAKILRKDGNVVLDDLNSHNGTFLNGKKIKNATLSDQDKIYIGSCRLYYVKGKILYNVYKAVSNNKDLIKDVTRVPPRIVPANGIEVEVKDISRMVKCKKGTGINGGSKKYILQHVSLKISAGELVAVCGGSGAGKTTFMNCINGFEPATSGQVLINGMDLYKNYSSLKNNIGYVPQQDIVHDNLTLKSMLTYTAKLRLQQDITKSEIAEIVDNVLDMVDLTNEKDTYIKKLSGGQRKRASIAVELVSDPSLFFLDEPTSGLDPEAETHLMHSLKNLAVSKGKTVIVITHTLQNIDLFDKVIFLASGGKLCYYGSPENARKFFEVDNLTDAYETISKNTDLYVSKYQKMQGV